MSEQPAIYCCGKLGGPVRLIMTCLKADAFAAKQDGEVVCLLKFVPQSPYMILEDGSDVVPIPETATQKSDRLWREVRATRNALLDSSRWTIAVDSPLSSDCQNKWADYLKTLNRVTVDYTDPTAITWPTPPALEYSTVYAKVTATPTSATATATITTKK